MAAAPQPLTPPPGQPPEASVAPTTPTAVSPSPAAPSPAMQRGTQMLVGVVSNLRAISKAYPGTAPLVAQVFELMRGIVAKIMEHQEPGQPMAPPVSG